MNPAACVCILTAMMLGLLCEDIVSGHSLVSAPSMTIEGRLASWAESAYQYLQDVNCDEVKFTSSAECVILADRLRSQMNIYAAFKTSSVGKRLYDVLPDGGLSKQGPHDAILTIDPYPQASFGHLVLIFHIEYNTNRQNCESKDGIFQSNGDCLVLAHKRRCHNTVDVNEVPFPRRCEINFLPLVHLAGVAPDQLNQQLQCYSVSGFADCPERRPKNETSKLICNPLDSNRHHCQLANELSQHGRCRLFETCDHAVLMAGGWNRDHSFPSTADNVASFYRMLRNNGFHKNNIRVYYANGARSSKLASEDIQTVYPSTIKLAFRYHVQKICQSLLCADSLVIYLNSPATNDGRMLLWDIDGNGEMDSTEAYSPRELADDLRGCSANQVYVFVDQSYAGHLVKYFSRSKHHSRVIILGSGQEEDYSHDSEFTRYWTRSDQHQIRTCVTQLHEKSHLEVKLSRPTIHDGSAGTVRTTVFGAPCDVTSPFSREELRSNYFGCQNVPTRVWLSRSIKPISSLDKDDDYNS